MPTHSSILAQRIPWTEEPGGLWGCKESDTTETTKHACKVRFGQKGQHPGLHSSPRDKAVLSPEDSTQFLASTEGEC